MPNETVANSIIFNACAAVVNCQVQCVYLHAAVSVRMTIDVDAAGGVFGAVPS